MMLFHPLLDEGDEGFFSHGVIIAEFGL
jgi:hypothetical protein